MNILFLSTHINTGGITSYLFTLTRNLIKRGHNIFIVSAGGNMKGQFEKAGAVVIDMDIKTKSELSYKLYVALNPIYKIIRDNRIDIIHSNSRITQVIGSLLSFFTKVAHVSTCHGFFKPRLTRKIFKCWGKRVIAISKQVAMHLKNDLNVKADKISLIESGVDIDNFYVADEKTRLSIKREFGFNNEPVLGIIARLSDVKGQDILIYAMKVIVDEIPNVKLVIVGQGKTENMLKRLSEKLGVGKNVTFYPIVNKTSEILNMLDVFIMPSRMEGLGLSVLEAQASGVPVVASNVGGIPTLIEDGKTGYLVESENVKALAMAVIKVLKNKEQARIVGLNGRKFVEDRFSSDIMIDKIISLYNYVKKDNIKNL